MTVAERPTRRRWFLRKRVLIPLGTGIALILLGYFLVLPWVVRGRVEAVLSQLKLRDVTFRVTRATPWTSTVRDIDAGGGTRIDLLRVTYSAGGLWHRRVDNIRIDGLHLAADVHEGKLSLGPLDAMLRGSATQPSTTATAPTSPETQEEASAEDWPFRSIRMEGSELVVRTPQREIALPFKGRVEWPRFHIDAKGLSIDGAVAGDGAPAVQFRGEHLAGADISAIAQAMAPSLPLAVAGAVNASGSISTADHRTSFDVQLATTRPSAEPATQLAGTNVTLDQGVFHITGVLGDGEERIMLSANHVAASESSVGAKISGAGGSVSIVSLSPTIETAPQQELRADRISASKFELTNGVARFDVAPADTLNLHEAKANFLGGEVSVTDARVKLGEPIAVTLQVKNVQLRDLLGLLAQGKATGEGTVNGRLPLIIRPDGEVSLGEGAFEATAGGRLSLTDEDTLQSIAGQAAKTAAQAPQAQVRNNIVEALRDFEFQKLSARLDNEPGGLVAYVTMAGRGRTGARQALTYDLRVAGLSDLLHELISVQRTVTREADRP
jgi:hypothetical protein